jgi:hypothetical protein
MKSLTRTFALAAIAVATAGVLNANADDQPQPSSPATATPATSSSTSTTSPQGWNESPQLQWFEGQESILDAPSYNPAAHPDAKPAPRSAHPLPSVWDNPFNTEELG